jgi:hypothetical protein
MATPIILVNVTLERVTCPTTTMINQCGVSDDSSGLGAGGDRRLPAGSDRESGVPPSTVARGILERCQPFGQINFKRFGRFDGLLAIRIALRMRRRCHDAPALGTSGTGPFRGPRPSRGYGDHWS